LCLGDLIGIDATLPYPMLMHMQHDMGRLLTTLLKKLLQHQNYELHRRVVVVEQKHTVESRPLGLRPRLGDDTRPVVVVVKTWGTNRIAHARVVDVTDPPGILPRN